MSFLGPVLKLEVNNIVCYVKAKESPKVTPSGLQKLGCVDSMTISGTGEILGANPGRFSLELFLGNFPFSYGNSSAS